MNKDTKMALGISFVGIAMLALYISLQKPSAPTSSTVRIEDGVQVIEVTANGGYSPAVITAQAGMTTELHLITNGTYDCSSVVVIPELGYQKTLKPTGTETVTIAPEDAQGTLEGTCGMGMYDFEITFS